jgi:hypothetical protein
VSDAEPTCCHECGHNEIIPYVGTSTVEQDGQPLITHINGYQCASCYAVFYTFAECEAADERLLAMGWKPRRKA